MDGRAQHSERVGSDREGPANPGFYALAAQPADHAFHDVTVESSGVTNCAVGTPSMCNNSDPGPASLTVGALAGYEVGSGYDLATGLGTPDVGALVTAWDTTITLAPATLSVAAGKTATTEALTTGLGATPTFACSGLPANAACEFAAGSGSGGATVTIDTSGGAGSAAGAVEVDPRSRGLLGLGLGLGVWLVVLRTRRPRARALAFGLAFAAAASCGSGHATPDAPAAAAGTYTVVVTATTGPATATTTLSLTVTP